MPITTLPAAPLITDSPSVFDAKASAFVGAQAQFVTEMNAAIAAVNMTKWISGTTYAIGDVTWSPITFYAYRRKTAGAGTTDPSADATNWAFLSDQFAPDLQKQTYVAFPTGGTSTAYTITPSPSVTSNAANTRFNAKFHTAAGASPTLAASGLTALPLKYYDQTGVLQAVTASQFGTNFTGDVVSDGTNWILLNAPGVPAKSVKGTSTNDAAAAGYVGEYIESFAGPVSAPASNTFGDITSITLTAGDWDVSCIVSSILNTGTSITSVSGGLGNASGTSGSGLTNGDTQGYSVPPTAQYQPSITIPAKRVSIASTTTYYLKMWMSYSGGTPQFQGRISARRVR